MEKYWEDSKLPREEYDEYETVEKGHGRIETRKYRVTEKIEWLAPRNNWKGLRSIVMVEHQREMGYHKSVERRYYLTSLKAQARGVAKAIRTHWEIESKVHWCLDVTFREDQSTVRVREAARNFALLRRLALNMLRKDVATKKSIRMKRHLAGWDPKYLELVLAIN